MQHKTLIKILIAISTIFWSCSTIKVKNTYYLPEDIPTNASIKMREDIYDKYKLVYITDNIDSYKMEYFLQGELNRNRKASIPIRTNSTSVSIEELFRQNETAYNEYQLGLIFKSKEQRSTTIKNVASISLVGGVFSLCFSLLSRGLDISPSVSDSLLTTGTLGIIAGGFAYPIGAIPRFFNNTLKHSAFRTATAYFNIWLRDYYNLNTP
jgi:hypothetical protein